MITFAEHQAKCEKCGRTDVPRTAISNNGKVRIILCAFCYGDAIALPTGWKIATMLRQWHTIRVAWRKEVDAVDAKAVKRASKTKLPAK